MAELTSETSESLIERRRLPRLQMRVPIQFRNVLKPHEVFSGSLSRDVSASGVRVSTSNFLPKEARLVLLVFMPELLKPIRLIARVAWMQKQRFTENYDCGFQFVEITPEDRRTIAELVERGVIIPEAPQAS